MNFVDYFQSNMTRFVLSNKKGCPFCFLLMKQVYSTIVSQPKYLSTLLRPNKLWKTTAACCRRFPDLSDGLLSFIIPGYYMCLLGDYIDKIRDHILNILIRK